MDQNYISNTMFHDTLLAELVRRGLQFHADINRHVKADDQIQEEKFDHAVGKLIEEKHVEQQECAKLKMVTLFRENESGAGGIVRSIKPEYYSNTVTTNVTHTVHPLQQKFVRETARIVEMPIMKSFANNNVSGKGSSDVPKLHDHFIQSKAKTSPLERSNVISLEAGREKYRQSA